MRTLTGLPSLLPAVIAAAPWFLAVDRLMHRSGADEAAFASGLIVAFAIAVTLWRSGRSDLERHALAAQRCPRCQNHLAPEYERLSASSALEGLAHWSCTRCGYRHSEALTRPSDPP